MRRAGVFSAPRSASRTASHRSTTFAPPVASDTALNLDAAAAEAMAQQLGSISLFRAARLGASARVAPVTSTQQRAARRLDAAEASSETDKILRCATASAAERARSVATMAALLWQRPGPQVGGGPAVVFQRFRGIAPPAEEEPPAPPAPAGTAPAQVASAGEEPPRVGRQASGMRPQMPGTDDSRRLEPPHDVAAASAPSAPPALPRVSRVPASPKASLGGAAVTAASPAPAPSTAAPPPRAAPTPLPPGEEAIHYAALVRYLSKHASDRSDIDAKARSFLAKYGSGVWARIERQYPGSTAGYVPPASAAAAAVSTAAVSSWPPTADGSSAALPPRAPVAAHLPTAPPAPPSTSVAKALAFSPGPSSGATLLPTSTLAAATAPATFAAAPAPDHGRPAEGAAAAPPFSLLGAPPAAADSGTAPAAAPGSQAPVSFPSLAAAAPSSFSLAALPSAFGTPNRAKPAGNAPSPSAAAPAPAPQAAAPPANPAATPVVSGAPTAAPSAAAAVDTDTHSRALMAYYAVHNPAKADVAFTQRMVAKYGAGVWDELERKKPGSTAAFRPAVADASATAAAAAPPASASAPSAAAAPAPATAEAAVPAPAAAPFAAFGGLALGASGSSILSGGAGGASIGPGLFGGFGGAFGMPPAATPAPATDAPNPPAAAPAAAAALPS